MPASNRWSPSPGARNPAQVADAFRSRRPDPACFRPARIEPFRAFAAGNPAVGIPHMVAGLDAAQFRKGFHDRDRSDVCAIAVMKPELGGAPVSGDADAPNRHHRAVWCFWVSFDHPQLRTYQEHTSRYSAGGERRCLGPLHSTSKSPVAGLRVKEAPAPLSTIGLTEPYSGLRQFVA